MRWFKHYTDASRSEKLAALREISGLEGYARYWLLVEFLSEKFDGTNTEFVVNKKTLGRHLGYYRPTMAKQWLDIGHTLGLFQLSLSGQCEVNDKLNYLIVFPKLLELKDNHTRNLQAKTKSVAPRIEENRTEENRLYVKGINPDIVVQLWNDKMAPTHGFCHGIGTGKHLERFIESRKFLKEKHDWENLFDAVSKLKQVEDNFNWKPNLTWLCDYDNALKILNGNMATKKESWLDSYEAPDLGSDYVG